MKKSTHLLSKFAIQNFIIIIICLLLGGGGAFFYAKHKQRTTYKVKTSMVVGHDLAKLNYRNSAVMSDLNMMDTYADQVNNPEVLKRAHKMLPSSIRHKYTVKDLNDCVSVSTEDHSLVMTIEATTENSKYSTEIANATAKAYKAEFSKMNNSGAEVKLLAPAEQSDAIGKTTPSKKKYVKLGAAFGLLIGLLISFLRISYKKLL